MRKNKILPFTTTQKKLEDIIPNDRSQTQKDKYYMISLICRKDDFTYIYSNREQNIAHQWLSCKGEMKKNQNGSLPESRQMEPGTVIIE